jgi:pyridoxal phosphate enzyme (YggS family)
MDIKQNINNIKERVHTALKTTNREGEEVTIIGVTKTVDIESIQEAVSSGLLNLGENRVQELTKKYDSIKDAKWHMIGTLQRNKVKYIIDKVELIHSLDSLSLAREINKHAERIQRIMPVLVQINIGNEKTKAGIPSEEALPFIESIFNLKNIKVMGLMTIAPLMEDPELVRPYFRTMKQIYDELKNVNYPHTDIQYLSMGMSYDFEVAIEEGSNMIRIGTAIFGQRKKEE